MAWIELHQTLWQDRKTLLLAGLLGVEDEIAALRVIRLWHWSLDNAEDGDLSGLPSHIIAKASGWTGNADEYLGALVESGFLDRAGECISIHNWWDYAGRLIERRRVDAERKRTSRRKGQPEDVHRMSEGCPPDVQRNRTVPNHTEPKEAGRPNTKRAREEPAASLTQSLKLTEDQAGAIQAAIASCPEVDHGFQIELWKNENPRWDLLPPRERASRAAKWLLTAEKFRQQDEARASPNGHSPPPALSTLPDDPEEDALWRQRDEELRAKAHERSKQPQT